MNFLSNIQCLRSGSRRTALPVLALPGVERGKHQVIKEIENLKEGVRFVKFQIS